MARTKKHPRNPWSKNPSPLPRAVFDAGKSNRRQRSKQMIDPISVPSVASCSKAPALLAHFEPDVQWLACDAAAVRQRHSLP